MHETGNKINKLSCESTTNPAPVLHITRFLGVDKKCNQVFPWSLHNFPENFIQIGPDKFLVILLTKKQRKNEKERKKSIENDTPSPDVSEKIHINKQRNRGRGNNLKVFFYRKLISTKI